MAALPFVGAYLALAAVALLAMALLATIRFPATVTREAGANAGENDAVGPGSSLGAVDGHRAGLGERQNQLVPGQRYDDNACRRQVLVRAPEHSPAGANGVESPARRDGSQSPSPVSKPCRFSSAGRATDL